MFLVLIDYVEGVFLAKPCSPRCLSLLNFSVLALNHTCIGFSSSILEIVDVLFLFVFVFVLPSQHLPSFHHLTGTVINFFFESSNNHLSRDERKRGKKNEWT